MQIMCHIIFNKINKNLIFNVSSARERKKMNISINFMRVDYYSKIKNANADQLQNEKKK